MVAGTPSPPLTRSPSPSIQRKSSPLMGKAKHADASALYAALKSSDKTPWHGDRSTSYAPDDFALLENEMGLELGHSSFNGSAKIQMDAHKASGSYPLKASRNPSKAVQNISDFLKPKVMAAWQFIVEKYPAEAAEQLAQVPEEARLWGTAFTKITVG